MNNKVGELMDKKSKKEDEDGKSKE